MKSQHTQRLKSVKKKCFSHLPGEILSLLRDKKMAYYTLISSISSGTILYADIVPPNLKLGKKNILKTMVVYIYGVFLPLASECHQ